MIWDDFCIVSSARDMGLAQSFQQLRDTHYGSYTDIIVQAMMAPLDTLGPAIYTFLGLGIWQVGFGMAIV